MFPAEVESFLVTHPAIAQAAVLGVPHRALGEALEAFVVPAPGATIEPREVIRFAREGIAGYKVPYCGDGRSTSCRCWPRASPTGAR